MISRMRFPLVLLAGAVTIAACSSADRAPEDAARATAPSTTVSTLDAAGRQHLRGHLTEAIRNASTEDRVPSATPMTITLGLAVKDMRALLDAANQVADPNSPSYRQYLTLEQFADRFGATREEYETVLGWARSKGLTVSPHANRLLATVSGSVGDLEEALRVHMVYGKRPDGSRFFAPDAEPSVDLAVPIAHVSGLQNFALPRAMAGSGAGGRLEGDDFRNAYAPCTSLDGSGQTIGIADFNNEAFAQSDIDGFAAMLGKGAFRPVQLVPGGIPAIGLQAGQIGVETTLDIETALTMAPAAQIVLFFGNELDILGNMVARTDIKQFSSSWFFYDVGASHQALLAELALQGQSFFQASGDGGAYPIGAFSDTQDGHMDIRQLDDLTLVGGTNLSLDYNGTIYTFETAWNDGGGFAGSGGIEAGVALPSYQRGIAGKNGASATHRNVPDVSAQAEDSVIYFAGQAATPRGNGTSMATPLWAGFMALVNEQAAKQGSPSIGFANASLYAIAASSAYATSFHDVVPGCISNSSNFSYCAGVGYDLATGLGSPQCGLISALAHSPAPPPPPRCSMASTCDQEYFPPGYGSPVGYHTIETISLSCASTASVLEEYVNGKWNAVPQFVANASYYPNGVPNEFAIGTQSNGVTTSGAPIGSTHTLRACATSAGGITCDLPRPPVTITSCACRPVTCQAGMCGTLSDDCGGTINCGGCGTGQSCSNNFCHAICTTMECKCDQEGGLWTGSACCTSAKCRCLEAGGDWNGSTCS